MTMHISLPTTPSATVIDEDCTGAGIMLGEGTTWPSFEWRKDYYADSKWVSGKRLKTAVLDQSQLTFVAIVRDTTAALLRARCDALEDALAVWLYDVTLNVDGESWTYEAELTAPNWGQVIIGHRKLHVRVGRISIPINPPA